MKITSTEIKVLQAFSKALGFAQFVRTGETLSIGTSSDEFTVSVTNGRITWHDFSHSTDLGPLDGSELAAKLDEFSKTKGGAK